MATDPVGSMENLTKRGLALGRDEMPDQNSEDTGVTLSTIVVAGDTHVSAELGEEVLVMHLDTGRYHSLQNVSAVAWKLVASPISVSDLADAVARRYGAPRERCRRDILELVAELLKRGLIQIV